MGSGSHYDRVNSLLMRDYIRGRKGILSHKERLDRLVQDYGSGQFDYYYQAYDPRYLKYYPPDLAQAIAYLEEAEDEAAED
jgi:hypothetical protein